MLIVPRGYAERFARVPWMTLALIVVNTLIFAVQPDYLQRVQRSFFRELATLVAQHQAQESQAFMDSCHEQGTNEALCQRAETEFRARLPKMADFDERSLRQGAPAEAWIAVEYVGKRLEQMFRHPSGDERALLARAHSAHGIFSGANINAWSVLQSQFRHAGFLHLFGNMLVLFTIGAWVEQRVAPALYLMIYLVGGSAGFLLMGASCRPLVGASAGVSTILGLCLALFSRVNMRFLLFAPPYAWKRELFAPTWGFLIVAHLCSDLAGLMGREEIEVAVKAHLGGWLIGMTAGWLIAKFQPLRGPYLYMDEPRQTRSLLIKAKSGQVSPRRALGRALDLLKLNRENTILKAFAVRQLLAGETPLNDQSQKLLLRFATELLSHGVEVVGSSLEWLVRMSELGLVPELMRYLGARNQRDLLDAAITQGHDSLASELLDLYETYHPKAKDLESFARRIRRETDADAQRQPA